MLKRVRDFSMLDFDEPDIEAALNFAPAPLSLKCFSLLIEL
jgi:hypothetical protein